MGVDPCVHGKRLLTGDGIAWKEGMILTGKWRSHPHIWSNGHRKGVPI